MNLAPGFFARRLQPAWAAAVLLGCGDTAGSDLAPLPGPRDGYAPGPYGTDEGDTIGELSFVAWDGATWSLGDLYRAGDQRLLVISTASGWCVSCVEEQPALQSLFEERGPDGLVVAVSLFEDADYNPVEPDYAAQWRDRFDLTFPVVVDAEFTLGQYYDPTLTPLVMIVDLITMEILSKSTGWDEQLVTAIANARLGDGE